MFRIQKGLDLPISGAPSPDFDTGRPVRRVALVGDDYVGMKPKMQVQVGDSVKLGQVLFEDKKTPGGAVYRARLRDGGGCQPWGQTQI